ncbi:molybdenum cofactor biosynthesis protein A [Alcanivorax sp. NBRC 101098]|jgi:cyclic pyranopterin phosphate synthase|uniref:GTP 3',8-cyclase MoaA n=2 Tax=Alcanivoracaceae TaxID=224372 RepID=UPI0004ABDAAC|nr:MULTISPECIES: GTP 3',8-cyclase MoaA [unclassified Alcanivorax]BAP15276.1 molybdenum cofactor biosynthesis protein A [Alcanivorax sp. NBRC 101098]
MNADVSTDNPVLQDRFGRAIDYVRLSVTDRCDFRCVYCMAEDMTFVPRAQVLTLEEMSRLARVLVRLGVKRIRLTGGEPLVRRDVAHLVRDIGAIEGLRELNMTTNGAGLTRHAVALKAAGLNRLNISLDSLDPERFKALTRTGNLVQVLAGIDAARAAGFERIKLNSVIMRGRNHDEVPALVDFALARGLDISFIEEMPLGQITEHDRELAFVSSAELREQLSARLELVPLAEKTGGPSRYWQAPGSNSRIGFISPHSQNFCHLCNRVRITAEGRMLLCLGHEHSVDLRAVLRAYPDDDTPLREAIVDAMAIKPERHDFSLEPGEQLVRFMNMTGG